MPIFTFACPATVLGTECRMNPCHTQPRLGAFSSLQTKPQTYSLDLGGQHFACSLCFVFPGLSSAPWFQWKLGTPLALTPASASRSSSTLCPVSWGKHHVGDPGDLLLPRVLPPRFLNCHILSCALGAHSQSANPPVF